MAINLIVKEAAELDIIEIVDWYDFKKQGLGDRFYKELLTEFDKIILRPTSYSYYKKDFIREILKYFPCLIILKATEKEIIIYSIFYGGRNPALINKKIN